MTGSGNLRIAKIRGVNLELHVSLLLLLPYLVFVTAVRFPLLVRETGVSVGELSFGPITWGFVIAVFLFVSVLLHEFGHVLVAQAQGIKVRSVTLMMLGGISAMEKVPEQSYSELKLAVVGPLVSLGLSAVLFYVHLNSKIPDLLFFSYWMGSLNLALGIFNLLPAFPLDGGRALRSILAAKHGMVRATQISTKFSKVFAWLLGIVGLIGFNILIILIAFFIYSAAQGELFYLLSRGILKGLRAGDVLCRVGPLQERDNLETTANRMLETMLPVLPVETEEGGVHLVLIHRTRQVPRDFWSVTLVRDVMEKSVRTVDINEPIGEAFFDLASAPQGALPVLESGKVVGIVRYSDVSQIIQVKSLAGEGHGPEEEGARKIGENTEQREREAA